MKPWDRNNLTFTILAASFSDGHAEYVRLASEEPERITGGCNVRLTLPQNFRSLEGLRVFDYSVTDLAWSHTDTNKAVDILNGSLRLINTKQKETIELH